MLLTEQGVARRNNTILPQPLRRRKVQRSMAAIKTVLGERKQVKIAAFRAERAMMEDAMEEEAETMTDEEVVDDDDYDEPMESEEVDENTTDDKTEK